MKFSSRLSGSGLKNSESVPTNGFQPSCINNPFHPRVKPGILDFNQYIILSQTAVIIEP
jgi:hypothetical protein